MESNKMKTKIIKIEIGYACGAGANHLSTLWEGEEKDCPWDELEQIANEKGKVLVSSEN